MWKWFSRKKSGEQPKYKCLCCGYYTISSNRGFRCHGDICPVCFWEEDALLASDAPSDANHGLTLAQAKKNYQEFGACEKRCLKFVRRPRHNELSGIDD